VDEFIFGDGIDHEQGEVDPSRNVAPQDWVTDVSAPYRKALALPLFQVAGAY
jgi:hypothetical protein